jgi:phosphosulfolactate synthase
MNFNLSKIPGRTAQPRGHGLTVISDKGLSFAEAENLLSIAGPYVDMIKLAFGTALVTPSLKEKIQLYQSSQIPVYFGGLLFEAFVIRDQTQEYIKMMEHYNLSHVEISDGAIQISHEQKCNYIREFCKNFTVISEVGSKDKDKVQVTPPYKWIQLMQAELQAGSTYLVAEAKESGTMGIYRDSGEVREGLVEEILTKLPAEKIIWETPKKDQQLYFIKRLGCNANLANIPASEVIALEAMRVGLRSDSFSFYLENE